MIISKNTITARRLTTRDLSESADQTPICQPEAQAIEQDTSMGPSKGGWRRDLRLANRRPTES